jgi:hypothetical protein
MATPLTDTPASLLVKLGSIMVHAEELIGPGGHAFDLSVLKGLLEDPEVLAWREQMDALALLPVKRGE